MENIARVRRDEAQAKAREEEEERRMQEVDAERRIKILRGQRPDTPPPPPSEQRQTSGSRRVHGDEPIRHKKRRRLAGEDDTDRDIRFARENAALVADRRDERLAASDNGKGRDEHVSIVDGAGHINLFSENMTRNQKVEKHPEAEAEAAKKKREHEDQYTMRFSNAAGFKESIRRDPWYSSSAGERPAQDLMPNKDVWGNEDSMRQEREKARIDANDPLGAMRAGIRGLKQVERERKRWREEKARELEALRRAERSRDTRRPRKMSRSRSRESSNSLENFSLDVDPVRKDIPDKDNHRSKHRHRHHRSHRHRREDRPRDSDPKAQSSSSHRHQH